MLTPSNQQRQQDSEMAEPAVRQEPSFPRKKKKRGIEKNIIQSNQLKKPRKDRKILQTLLQSHNEINQLDLNQYKEVFKEHFSKVLPEVQRDSMLFRGDNMSHFSTIFHKLRFYLEDRKHYPKNFEDHQKRKKMVENKRAFIKRLRAAEVLVAKLYGSSNYLRKLEFEEVAEENKTLKLPSQFYAKIWDSLDVKEPEELDKIYENDIDEFTNQIYRRERDLQNQADLEKQTANPAGLQAFKPSTNPWNDSPYINNKPESKGLKHGNSHPDLQRATPKECRKLIFENQQPPACASLSDPPRGDNGTLGGLFAEDHMSSHQEMLSQQTQQKIIEEQVKMQQLQNLISQLSMFNSFAQSNGLLSSNAGAKSNNPFLNVAQDSQTNLLQTLLLTAAGVGGAFPSFSQTPKEEKPVMPLEILVFLLQLMKQQQQQQQIQQFQNYQGASQQQSVQQTPPPQQLPLMDNSFFSLLNPGMSSNNAMQTNNITNIININNSNQFLSGSPAFQQENSTAIFQQKQHSMPAQSLPQPLSPQSNGAQSHAQSLMTTPHVQGFQNYGNQTLDYGQFNLSNVGNQSINSNGAGGAPLGVIGPQFNNIMMGSQAQQQIPAPSGSENLMWGNGMSSGGQNTGKIQNLVGMQKLSKIQAQNIIISPIKLQGFDQKQN